MSPLVEVLAAAANESNKVTTTFDVIGIVVSLSAMLVQRLADNQLCKFRKAQYKKYETKELDQLSFSSKICRDGPWNYSDTQTILQKPSLGLV